MKLCLCSGVKQEEISHKPRMQCDKNVIVVTLYQFKCFYFIQGTCKVATGFNG